MAAILTQLNQRWAYYFWLMAEGDELRQINLRSICFSLITTDAITTKTSFQIVLCTFNPGTKGLSGAVSLIESVRLNHVWIFFFFYNKRCISPVWGQCWCLAPRRHTFPSATNGFNPHKLEEVPRQEAKITGIMLAVCVCVCLCVFGKRGETWRRSSGETA